DDVTALVAGFRRTGRRYGVRGGFAHQPLLPRGRREGRRASRLHADELRAGRRVVALGDLELDAPAHAAFEEQRVGDGPRWVKAGPHQPQDRRARADQNSSASLRMASNASGPETGLASRNAPLGRSASSSPRVVVTTAALKAKWSLRTSGNGVCCPT